MNIDEMKRLAKVAIDNLNDAQLNRNDFVEIFTETEEDISAELGVETKKLGLFKPSELVRLGNVAVDEARVVFSSDIVKGKIILSTLAMSDDGMDFLDPLDKLNSVGSRALNRLDTYGREGYSPESLAQHFGLTVEDVEDHLKAQGII